MFKLLNSLANIAIALGKTMDLDKDLYFFVKTHSTTSSIYLGELVRCF